MKFGILIHDANDDVGIAVIDLTPNTDIGSATLEGEDCGSVHVVDNIPLGHKIALREIPKDKNVIEYGAPIGLAVQTIGKGSHVHIHNLKTLRWS